MPDDPDRPDTFVTLGGVHGRPQSTPVKMTETGDDTHQFIGRFDCPADLEVGDTFWVLHPQRESAIEDGDVLGCSYSSGRRTRLVYTAPSGTRSMVY